MVFEIISVIVIFAVVFSAIHIRKRMVRSKCRKRMLAEPIPLEYKTILQQKIPLYNRLPAELQRQLEGLINVFLAEKQFEGCLGLVVTDEMKVTIAAQACVLLLNRKTRYYPKLNTIYIYPEAYTARHMDEKGLVSQQVRLGESWQDGPVVLAWNSVTGGAINIRDGRNVVFHEFAHQLDQEDGVADGAPILENRSCYASWAKVLGNEYRVLQKKATKYRRSVLDRYGASHPAEFFAVATEAFLEKPRQLQKKHPELYDELRQYYRLDPAVWTSNER